MDDDLVTLIEMSQRAGETSEEDALELESAVQLEPHNLNLRCRLFCYHKLNKSAQKLVDELLWCIRHVPSSEYAWFVATRALGANLRTTRSEDYAVIKDAWLSKLENESDAKSFVTAADFFLLNKDLRLAQDLLLRVLSIEPNSSEAQSRLRLISERLDK